MSKRLDPRDVEGVSVRISDLLVATADEADPNLDAVIPEVLQLLRQRLQMDVVFVSEFVDGQRVFRFVDSGDGAPPLSVGDSGPLESSYCQRVVDGRLPEIVADLGRQPGANLETPFPIGAHLSTPVVLPDGSTYGTVCCFSTAPNPQLQQRDLATLRSCAELVARKVEAAHQQHRPVQWTRQPLESAHR